MKHEGRVALFLLLDRMFPPNHVFEDERLQASLRWFVRAVGSAER